ncbi:hypothetical protein GXW83_32295 [Streptacidiphilus sp. PB12-B1b]|uniref:hypothetical protein n=1 Tax=Streptacidiphilus sp. PB12-B1b TaxID=2705012 RepID=UPI0015F97BEE|nr:hypothetical protein [Streptacidiphilus sp. PB12-B1b]QMU79690.1 hypothetical protein GXW83_32295 [Streptacidiphilus sp. PB12-B1b]
MSTPSWGQPGMPGQPGPYGPPPAPKKKPLRGCLGFGCGGVLAVVVIVVIAMAVAGSKTTATTSLPATGSAPTGTGHAAASKSSTVTYVLTGSSADVQYGAAGSSLQGHVPMKVTDPLGDPAYYSISAQLDNGGSVTCELEVNGKVISKATATGSYNIATCEIIQDPLSGAWQDANSG